MSEWLWVLGPGVAGGPQPSGGLGHLHPSNPTSGPTVKLCGWGRNPELGQWAWGLPCLPRSLLRTLLPLQKQHMCL